MPPGEVDDGQPPHSHRKGAILQKAFIVRAAVHDRRRHFPDQRERVRDARGIKADDAAPQAADPDA